MNMIDVLLNIFVLFKNTNVCTNLGTLLTAFQNNISKPEQIGELNLMYQF